MKLRNGHKLAYPGSKSRGHSGASCEKRTATTTTTTTTTKYMTPIRPKFHKLYLSDEEELIDEKGIVIFVVMEDEPKDTLTERMTAEITKRTRLCEERWRLGGGWTGPPQHDEEVYPWEIDLMTQLFAGGAAARA